jgi:CHAT domain-containing protein
MRLRLLLILSFTIFSCSNNTQNDIQKLEEKLYELNSINDEINELWIQSDFVKSEEYKENEFYSFYREGEKEHKDLKILFYEINNRVEKIENIILTNPIDDELNHLKLFFADEDIEQYSNVYRFYYNDYLYDLHDILYGIGYVLYDPENTYSIEYISFFKDYVDTYERLKPFIVNGGAYQSKTIVHAQAVLELLSNTDIFPKSKQKDWYQHIFKIYEDSNIIEQEIDRGYIEFFALAYDYMMNNYENVYTIGKTKKELTNLFNDFARTVLRKLDKDIELSIVKPLNLPLINYPLSSDEEKQFLYYLGFAVNSIAAVEYGSLGYQKETKVYIDKSINFFNKINFKTISSISDEYDKGNLLIWGNIFLYDLFYQSILTYSISISASNENILYQTVDDILSRINNLQELQDATLAIADSSEYLLEWKNNEENHSDFRYSDIDKLVKNLTVAILRTKDWLKEGVFPEDTVDLIERNAILGKFNIYDPEVISRFQTANNIGKNDSRTFIEFINTQSDKIYTDLIFNDYPDVLEAYQDTNINVEELFINLYDNDSNFQSRVDTLEVKLGLIYKEALDYNIGHLYLDDIKSNPEIFSGNFSILKTAINYGYFSQSTDLDLAKFGLSEEEAEYLLEILVLDKINNLFYTSITQNMLLYDYLLTGIEDDMARMSYGFNELYKTSNINVIYTSFSEGNSNNIESYTSYTITKENDKSAYNTFKIQKNYAINKHFDYDNFLHDLETLKSLITLKADAKKYQKSIYNDLLQESESELDKNAATVIVLDPLIQNIPFESLINSEDKYLFESGLWVRCNSLSDLMQTSKNLRENILSQEQRVNNFQNFIGLTDNIIDPKILALGGIDYELDTNNYQTIRGNSSLSFLPWTSIEIKSIKKRFRNAKILNGNSASETFIKTKNLNNYSVLHFATHGLSFYDNYKDSSLLLSSDKYNDGLLTYSEIINLDLTNVDIVFLSACETNFARPFKNLTSPSIQQAFKVAGAASVISTLWVIDDKASSLFVDIYYEEYLKTGFSVYALNQARIRFIEKYPQYAHPYYWAAFAHFGV